MELNGNESSRSETVDCAPCPNDRSSQNNQNRDSRTLLPGLNNHQAFQGDIILDETEARVRICIAYGPYGFEVLNPQTSQNRIIQDLYFMNGFVIQWQMFCLQWYARCIKSLLHGVKFLPVLVCDNRFSSNFRILVTAFLRIWSSTRSDKKIIENPQEAAIGLYWAWLCAWCACPGVGNCPILGILDITVASIDHIPNGWVMFNGDI